MIYKKSLYLRLAQETNPEFSLLKNWTLRDIRFKRSQLQDIQGIKLNYGLILEVYGFRKMRLMDALHAPEYKFNTKKYLQKIFLPFF